MRRRIWRDGLCRAESRRNNFYSPPIRPALHTQLLSRQLVRPINLFLGGYGESEYVVPCGCHRYGVGVPGLESECTSIDDDVDCHDLVCIDSRSCPVRLCVLVAIVSDTVRGEPNAHRPVAPYVQGQIRWRVDL